MAASDAISSPGRQRQPPSLRALLDAHFMRRQASQLKMASLTSAVAAATPEAIAPAAAAAPATGWVAYTSWSNQSGTPITSFESTWIVPPVPVTKSGQIVYLFNSLEIPELHILQPVLLWGTVSDVPGSGDFWTIASWWVGKTDKPFHLTELIPVNPGERLTGRITMYRQEGPLYDYTCEFVGRTGTKLLAGNLPQLTDCTETLEAYNITSDSDYPDTDQTSFSAISLQTGAAPAQFTWTRGGEFPPNVAPDGREVQIVYPRGEA